MARVSIRAYARHRGVSHTAVRKALATGRISADAAGAIDPVEADRQWASATDPSKPLNSVTGTPRLRRSGARGEAQEREHALSAPDPVDAASQGDVARLASSYAGSRAAREAYLARLAKLDFEQRSGKLVDADQVRAQLFALGRRIRDSIQGIPDRLAPVLAGESDAAAVHRLMSEELERALRELAAGLKQGGK